MQACETLSTLWLGNVFLDGSFREEKKYHREMWRILIMPYFFRKITVWVRNNRIDCSKSFLKNLNTLHMNWQWLQDSDENGISNVVWPLPALGLHAVVDWIEWNHICKFDLLHVLGDENDVLIRWETLSESNSNVMLPKDNYFDTTFPDEFFLLLRVICWKPQSLWEPNSICSSYFFTVIYFTTILLPRGTGKPEFNCRLTVSKTGTKF